MPTYTYRCSNCGVEFDKFQKFSEKPLTRCPECRIGRVSRIPQPSTIVFKGSGWYSTDHKSASGQSSRKSEGETSKGETSKGETSKDETSKGEAGKTEAGKTEKTESKPAKKEQKAAAADD